MQPGDLLQGRYRIIQPLGSGGFADVFLGEDEGSGRRVAIKMVRDSHQTRRFQRELTVVAGLRSAHTVRLFDHGHSDSGHQFLVFEYVPGVDLTDLLQRGPQPPAVVEHIARQLLDALAEAHASGILHRDIKPQNVRVFDYAGDPHQVKLLDFGIAQRADADERLTATGEILGTFRYMSPEQLRSQRVTPASDLYSLGLVLLELLQGPHALHGDSLSDQLPRLEPGYTFPIDGSTALTATLATMLAFQPQHRPQSAQAVLRGLAMNVAAPRPTSSQPLAATSQATNRGAILFVVILLAITAVAGVMGVIAWRATTENRSPRIVPSRRVGAVETPPRAPVERVARPATDEHRSDDDEPDAGNAVQRGTCGVISEPGTYHLGDAWLYLPGSYDGNTKLPAVFALSANTQMARRFVEGAGLDEAADKHNFIVVAPTRGAGNHNWDTRRVIRRMQGMITQLASEYCVDPDAIFATGLIGGGTVAENLACEPWIRAAAVMSTRPGKAESRCTSPKPFMLMNGLRTRQAPIEGGRNCNGDVKIALAIHEEFWRDANGCQGARRLESQHKKSKCYTWACAKAPFVSCRLDGGHNWPGAPSRLADFFECDGPSTDYPATDRVFEFFKNNMKAP